jgi:hypothetical protein
MVSSTSTISLSSTILVSISSSSLNHLIVGLGLPLYLIINEAFWPSLTVTFSSFPNILAGA